MYTVKRFSPNQVIQVLCTLDSGKQVVLHSGSSVRWAVVDNDGNVASTIVSGTKIYQVYNQKFIAQKEAEFLNKKQQGII